VHLLLEPGRSIIAPAGVLLTRVLYTKTNRGKTFVIVDSAMNDLMRPALYGGVHPITKVRQEGTERDVPRQRVDVVGRCARQATASFTIGRWVKCERVTCLPSGSPGRMEWRRLPTTTRDAGPRRSWWKGTVFV